MTEPNCSDVKELLREVIGASGAAVRRFFQYDSEVAERPDLIQKLKYVAEHYPAENKSTPPENSLIIYPFFHISYEDLLECAAIPDRMGFTEEERVRYHADFLHWSRVEDYCSLKPLLAALYNDQWADKIIRHLYFPAARVGLEQIQDICERLLSYPVRIDPEWFGNYWFLLFSYCADPCRVLDELDKRFKAEYVMEVFTSNDEWSQIGYGLSGGLIGEMRLNPHYADEAFEEAERKFSEYRL